LYRHPEQQQDEVHAMLWHILCLPVRPWKDHFKSDLRSDQDHRQKNDLRSDQDHRFGKSDLDLRSFKKIISKKITFFNFETDKKVTFLYFYVVFLLF
jgi:hypothetical protein